MQELSVCKHSIQTWAPLPGSAPPEAHCVYVEQLVYTPRDTFVGTLHAIFEASS